MCSPPLRSQADQEALWEGLRNGVLDIVSSDHAPYRYDDPCGKKAHGEARRSRACRTVSPDSRRDCRSCGRRAWAAGA